MKLPKWLTTVTPFSKYLAMFLFILLPFVGFFLGVQFNKLTSPSNVIPSPVVVISPTPSPQIQIPPAIDPNDSLEIQSKKAILWSGISEAYFNRHFSFLKDPNQFSGDRVGWMLTIEDWQFTIEDEPLLMTNYSGQQVSIRSIATDLHGFHQVDTLISKPQATKFVNDCLTRNKRNVADFTYSAEFVPHSRNPNDTAPAMLVYIAKSKIVPTPAPWTGPPGTGSRAMPQPESLQINLENGACTTKLYPSTN